MPRRLCLPSSDRWVGRLLAVRVHSGCDQGQVCNEYGLCGDRQPPVVGGTEEPEPPQDGDDVDPEEPTQDGADTDDSGLDEQPAPGEEPESPADSSSDLGEASGQTSPEVDLRGSRADARASLAALVDAQPLWPCRYPPTTPRRAFEV